MGCGLQRWHGLSPRVRGNLCQLAHGRVRERSIPACTGEPSSSPRSDGPELVYPRVYGGTTPVSRRPGRDGGLSPRVRGNLFRGGGGMKAPRSIPACTGEPFAWAAGCSAGMVYPRVYGGTAFHEISDAGEQGLSPRVRGNRSLLPPSAGAARSIPACTGEPHVDCARNQCAGVYPRVYGGTSKRSLFVRPLVKG